MNNIPQYGVGGFIKGILRGPYDYARDIGRDPLGTLSETAMAGLVGWGLVNPVNGPLFKLGIGMGHLGRNLYNKIKGLPYSDYYNKILHDNAQKHLQYRLSSYRPGTSVKEEGPLINKEEPGAIPAPEQRSEDVGGGALWGASPYNMPDVGFDVKPGPEPLAAAAYGGAIPRYAEGGMDPQMMQQMMMQQGQMDPQMMQQMQQGQMDPQMMQQMMQQGQQGQPGQQGGVDNSKAAVDKGEVVRKNGKLQVVRQGAGGKSDDVLMGTSPDFAVLGNSYDPGFKMQYKDLGRKLEQRFDKEYFGGDAISDTTKAKNDQTMNNTFEMLMKRQDYVNQITGKTQQYKNPNDTQYTQNAYGGYVPRFASGGKIDWLKDAWSNSAEDFYNVGRGIGKDASRFYKKAKTAYYKGLTELKALYRNENVRKWAIRGGIGAASAIPLYKLTKYLGKKLYDANVEAADRTRKQAARYDYWSTAGRGANAVPVNREALTPDEVIQENIAHPSKRISAYPESDPRYKKMEKLVEDSKRDPEEWRNKVEVHEQGGHYKTADRGLSPDEWRTQNKLRDPQAVVSERYIRGLAKAGTRMGEMRKNPQTGLKEYKSKEYKSMAKWPQTGGRSEYRHPDQDGYVPIPKENRPEGKPQVPNNMYAQGMKNRKEMLQARMVSRAFQKEKAEAAAAGTDVGSPEFQERTLKKILEDNKIENFTDEQYDYIRHNELQESMAKARSRFADFDKDEYKYTALEPFSDTPPEEPMLLGEKYMRREFGDESIPKNIPQDSRAESYANAIRGIRMHDANFNDENRTALPDQAERPLPEQFRKNLQDINPLWSKYDLPHGLYDFTHLDPRIPQEDGLNENEARFNVRMSNFRRESQNPLAKADPETGQTMYNPGGINSDDYLRAIEDAHYKHSLIGYIGQHHAYMENRKPFAKPKMPESLKDPRNADVLARIEDDPREYDNYGAGREFGDYARRLSEHREGDMGEVPMDLAFRDALTGGPEGGRALSRQGRAAALISYATEVAQRQRNAAQNRDAIEQNRRAREMYAAADEEGRRNYLIQHGLRAGDATDAAPPELPQELPADLPTEMPEFPRNIDPNRNFDDVIRRIQDNPYNFLASLGANDHPEWEDYAKALVDWHTIRARGDQINSRTLGSPNHIDVNTHPLEWLQANPNADPRDRHYAGNVAYELNKQSQLAPDEERDLFLSRQGIAPLRPLIPTDPLNLPVGKKSLTAALNKIKKEGLEDVHTAASFQRDNNIERARSLYPRVMEFPHGAHDLTVREQGTIRENQIALNKKLQQAMRRRNVEALRGLQDHSTPPTADEMYIPDSQIYPPERMAARIASHRSEPDDPDYTLAPGTAPLPLSAPDATRMAWHDAQVKAWGDLHEEATNVRRHMETPDKYNRGRDEILGYPERREKYTKEMKALGKEANERALKEISTGRYRSAPMAIMDPTLTEEHKHVMDLPYDGGWRGRLNHRLDQWGEYIDEHLPAPLAKAAGAVGKGARAVGGGIMKGADFAREKAANAWSYYRGLGDVDPNTLSSMDRLDTFMQNNPAYLEMPGITAGAYGDRVQRYTSGGYAIPRYGDGSMDDLYKFDPAQQTAQELIRQEVQQAMQHAKSHYETPSYAQMLYDKIGPKAASTIEKARLGLIDKIDDLKPKLADKRDEILGLTKDDSGHYINPNNKHRFDANLDTPGFADDGRPIDKEGYLVDKDGKHVLDGNGDKQLISPPHKAASWKDIDPDHISEATQGLVKLLSSKQGSEYTEPMRGVAHYVHPHENPYKHALMHAYEQSAPDTDSLRAALDENLAKSMLMASHESDPTKRAAIRAQAMMERNSSMIEAQRAMDQDRAGNKKEFARILGEIGSSEMNSKQHADELNAAEDRRLDLQYRQDKAAYAAYMEKHSPANKIAEALDMIADSGIIGDVLHIGKDKMKRKTVKNALEKDEAEKAKIDKITQAILNQQNSHDYQKPVWNVQKHPMSSYI